MAEAKWLQISMTVDGEMAEAVAEVLDRFTSGGVVVETNVKYRDAEDEGTPYGPVKVYGYLIIDEQIEENRRKVEEALWHLHTIRELPQPEYKEIADENWMAAWKDHYHPIPIGKKLLILPAWIEQTDMTRVAVKIDPSMAFGTGTHPSTQLCLELVEDYTQPGKPVIDIGCGSGILSIAAIKMGASHALGVDIDAASIKATNENSQANAVDPFIETGLGSVAEIKNGSFRIKQAPVVLANILAPILIRLFDAGMADLISPGGVIILAGILAEQGESVRQAAEDKGLVFVEERHSGDWVALVMKKE
ncbi:MAG: 50S ribosomal protein L11 methyltransferase [Anaerolineaceae bacterium]|nr:50S ribosomal protein L11 methyltransferase [Anaerolineaceae bacterium]